MKLAVIFPGVGYHTDKPLLYYSKKLAKEYGFEVRELTYGSSKGTFRGTREEMQQAFDSALVQIETELQDIDFSKYEELLFISKSLGTAVAPTFARKHHLTAHNIYYTPVTESLDYMKQEGIVFTGTADPFANTEILKQGCEKLGLPLYITEQGNHSLETGNVLDDIEHLSVIMHHTKNYIESISEANSKEG